uniref:Serpin family A member 10 n=1 Tax=Crocodylus porosus TaxID=8502 RepID=A0A7M4ENR6_CROPO
MLGRRPPDWWRGWECGYKARAQVQHWQLLQGSKGITSPSWRAPGSQNSLEIQEENKEHFLSKKQTLSISEERFHHKNIPKPFEVQVPLQSTVYNVTEKSTNFGFNLYRKIAMQHDNNVLFSPLSLSFLMAAFMLATKGETNNQIVQGLNLHLLKDKENPYHLPALFKQLKENITANEEFILQEGSFAFIQKDFCLNEFFLNLSKEYFDMEFLSVDFNNSTQAKEVINQNVNKMTKGKIQELFEDFDIHAKLVLVDYIFFKGKWLHPFNARLTEPEFFHIDKYRSVQVPMMFKSDKVASTFDENLRCTVVKLPYKGRVHLLIAVPEKEGDYVSLEDHLTAELVELWLRNMKTRYNFFLPKFKLDRNYQMHKLLQTLGIKNLFTNQADLSQLTDQMYARNLSIVIQRAVIEVDERGTEAAAASGSAITAYSVPPTIKVNRPFLFMVFEETFKTLIFMGRVVNPTEL